jgi:NAD(P)-dependent dehydrogenase (short-subunit alcohol dehydrogenase family)
VDTEAGSGSLAWAGRVARELLDGGRTPLVGLSALGQRWTPTLLEQCATQGDDPLTDGDFLIVSGGARGITAASLGALATHHKLRLLLIGHTPLLEEPTILAGVEDDAHLKRELIHIAQDEEREVDLRKIGETAAAIQRVRTIRRTIASLEALGSQVRYACVDVRDEAAVCAAVAQVREQWGAPVGLVHGAGVVDDKLVAAKTEQQVRHVIETKLLGLQSLLAATRDDELRLLALFSSVVARMGNAGQSDYAIANEVLNAVARHEALRRGDRCLVKSIGWGPWNGGMVSLAIAEHMHRNHHALLSENLGAAAFLDELRDRTPGAVDPVIVAAGPA